MPGVSLITPHEHRDRSGHADHRPVGTRCKNVVPSIDGWAPVRHSLRLRLMVIHATASW